jgi:DNA-binding GntR family transcriptional regulator
VAARGSADVAAVRDIVDRLQERIGSGEIPIGGWIRQEQVAQEHGVSRTPVREALRQLEALGVVEMVAHRGARVTLPSTRDIAEALEVRGVLEGHAAQLAADRITEAQLEVLAGTDATFRRVVALARDPDAQEEARELWYRTNSLFHATVVDAAGNRQLTASLDALHHRLPRNLTWTGLAGDPRLLDRNADDHVAITAAIRAGEGERARSLTLQHARRAAEMILVRRA